MVLRTILKMVGFSYLEERIPRLRDPRKGIELGRKLNPAANAIFNKSEEQRDKIVTKFLDAAEKAGISEEKILKASRLMKTASAIPDEIDRTIVSLGTKIILGIDLSPVVSLTPIPPWTRVLGEVICDSFERGAIIRSGGDPDIPSDSDSA